MNNKDSLSKIAKNIKLIGFDVDGVLTNGDITYTDNGEEIKTFNAKDGQGIAMLNTEGFITVIITARKSPIVERRAKDLGITFVYQGAKNKFEAMQEVLRINNIDISEVAFIGDDLPDISVLSKVGLACCPIDAVDEVKAICNIVSNKKGGKGAVREIADFILSNKTDRIYNPAETKVN